MGLDWIVKNKPISGKEVLFNKIKYKIKILEKKEEESDEIEELRSKLEDISITPSDTLDSCNLSTSEIKELDDIFEGGSFLTSMHDFRGRKVSDSELINEELTEEAYEDHDAYKCIEYASRLEQNLSEYKYEELNEEQKDDYDDIIQAIKWLRFWGKHGHGYYAWY